MGLQYFAWTGDKSDMSKHVITAGITMAVLIGLAGCSDFRRAVGTEKSSPDEFAVVVRPPLSLPPGFTDRPEDILAKDDAETYGIQLEKRLPLQQLFGGMPDIGPVLDKMAEDTRLRKAQQDGRLPTDEATLATDPTNNEPLAVQ